MPESTFTYNGEEYSFSPERDIGISELRHIKSWFSDLGDYQAFVTAASLGDPDALACLIWIAQRKAGVKKVREPISFPDFSIGEVMGSFVSIDGVHAVDKVQPIRLTLNGEEYTFDLEKNLTHKVLKQIKRWYPSLGSLVRFTVGMFRGDPDALACIAWICWGGPNDKSVPMPNQIDLAAGGLLDSFDYDEPEEPVMPETPEIQLPDQEEPEAVNPPLPSDGISSSEGIQTNSGSVGSLMSPLPLASVQRKPNDDPSLSTSDGSTG